MEPEYPTANDWYKAHRPELKKYRGEWIAYTNKGVISQRSRLSKDEGCARSEFIWFRLCN